MPALNVSGAFWDAFFTAQPLSELRDCWEVENCGRWELDVQTLLAADYDADCEKRVTAELEEV